MITEISQEINAVKEVGLSAAELFKVARDGEKLKMTRSTLAITLALRLMFSGENKVDSDAIVTINRALPLMIAENDYCDVGLAAVRKLSSGYDQLTVYPLIELRNLLRDRRDRELKTIVENYGEDSNVAKVLQVFNTDMEMLAMTAESIPPQEFASFLEIDSALFEMACVGLIDQETVLKIVPDFFEVVPLDYKSLKKKYSFFVQDGLPNDPFEKKVFGLHMSEMVLKVSDDMMGESEDGMLNNPTFIKYVGSLHDRFVSLKSIKLSYRDRAVACGIPRLVVDIGDLTFSGVRNLKLKLSLRNTEPEEVSRMWKIIQEEHEITTKLREQLNRSSIMPEVFTKHL